MLDGSLAAYEVEGAFRDAFMASKGVVGSSPGTFPSAPQLPLQILRPLCHQAKPCRRATDSIMALEGPS